MLTIKNITIHKLAYLPHLNFALIIIGRFDIKYVYYSSKSVKEGHMP